MLTERRAAAAGFDPDQLHAPIRKERMKHPDGVASAADAGVNRVGQTPLGFDNLPSRFLANDAVKITNHYWIRMRAQRGTEQIVCRLNVGDPIAHRFTDPL